MRHYNGLRSFEPHSMKDWLTSLIMKLNEPIDSSTKFCWQMMVSHINSFDLWLLTMIKCEQLTIWYGLQSYMMHLKDNHYPISTTWNIFLVSVIILNTTHNSMMYDKESHHCVNTNDVPALSELLASHFRTNISALINLPEIRRNITPLVEFSNRKLVYISRHIIAPEAQMWACPRKAAIY